MVTWAASPDCELRSVAWGVQAKPRELNSREFGGTFPPGKVAGPMDSEGLSSSKLLDLGLLHGVDLVESTARLISCFLCFSSSPFRRNPMPRQLRTPAPPFMSLPQNLSQSLFR